VLGLVQSAQARWPELKPRTVVMGYSNGGIGSWYFARLYPSFFSAAVPMAFNDTIVGETSIPIHAIAGEKDELFDIKRVRAAVAHAQSNGVDLVFVERYRATHMTPCAYRPELERARLWLETHAFPKALRAGAQNGNAGATGTAGAGPR
jgi:predicted esterase